MPARQLAAANRPATRVVGRPRCTARRPAACCATALLLSACLSGADGGNPAAGRPTAAPAEREPPQTQPARIRPFQPGVLIDWTTPAVIVETEVVLREGVLEFLACWPGKEHESILRFRPPPERVFTALGLIGLNPGHPPRWNDKTNTYARPAGDLVTLACRWEHDGETRTTDAFAWLQETEYARPALRRPWIFSGSLIRPDHTLACGRTGVGVALVDFPDSLITLSSGYPSRYGALWAEARTEVLPPLGTTVQLVITPARLERREIIVDPLGRCLVDGRFTPLRELGDLLRLQRELCCDHVQTIEVAGALAADVRRIRAALLEQGVPAEALRIRRADAAAADDQDSR